MSSGGFTFNKSIDKLQVNISKKQNLIRQFRKMTSEKISKIFIETLKENILKQKLDLAPLSAEYKLMKARGGFDPRILIKTGKYIDSISIKKNKDGFIIEVPESIVTEEGLPLAQIGSWLENGTPLMPSRPHWEPTYIEVKNKHWKTSFDNFFDRFKRKS